MANDKTTRRTVLLDDTPATEDAFGPHKRVAGAIVSLVTTEPGGRAIAVEGGWGSGKSTVISFVRKALEADERYRVITFDAWAHEGDPLRRTYLETIIGSLKEWGWIAASNWDRKLDELANRRRSTTTRITPKPTWLGGIFAISLILVPIGTTLVAASFRGSQTAQSPDISDSCTWPWPAWIGGVLALAPFWVLGGNGLRLCCRWIYRKYRAWRGGATVAASPSSDWSFLLSRAIEETQTDTTETPNPTSIEFEGHFNAAMHEALELHPERRLILVLDNLDRVDPASALGVWSTLQTFLQERNGAPSTWFKRIWIVVPYDPVGLRKLWDNRVAVEATDADENETSVQTTLQSRIASDSFLDKSFQIRFQVSPPVLSDWKSYLGSLAAKALPDHSDGDRHILYRVYEEWRARHAMLPTPRELKLYVNQIGAIHRQWQDEFPIGHIAFYVLNSRHSDSLIEQLKSKDFPSTNARRLLKDDLVPSLAGLTFNVTAAKGMEFLLSDPIYNCLTKGTHQELAEIADRHGAGFWAVLELVVSSRVHDSAPGVVSNTGRVLFESQLLQNPSTESISIRTALREAVLAVSEWQPFDQQAANGLAAIHQLFNDEELSSHLMKVLATTLNKLKPSEKAKDVIVDPRALITVLNAVKGLGFEASIGQPITLPGDVESWVAACPTLSKELDKDLWPRITPKEKFDAVSSAIQSAVAAGDFNDRHIAAILVTHACVKNAAWGPLAVAIQDRLDASIGASVAEVGHLLNGLWALRKLSDAKAEKAMKALVSGGHIAHHLHQAVLDRPVSAMCKLTILHEAPTADTPPTVGNSATGHQVLLDSLASADQAPAEVLMAAISQNCGPSILFDIMDARQPCDPLIASCLRMVAASDSPQDLFTDDVILARWAQIQKAISSDGKDDPFDQLIERLAKTSTICDSLQRSEKGFVPQDSVLYWIIVRDAGMDVPEFCAWCKDGLEALDKDSWLQDLRDNHECVWLACMLAEKQVRPEFTTPLLDALEEHAGEVARAEHVPEEIVVKNWNQFLSLLEDSTAKALRSRVLAIAIAADGTLSQQFFEMYGQQLADSAALHANDRTVEGLFSPLVRERNVPGLHWLLGVIDSNRHFLDARPSSDNVGEFRTRLHDCLTNPKTDEAQPAIESLAALLGIAPPPPAENVESVENL